MDVERALNAEKLQLIKVVIQEPKYTEDIVSGFSKSLGCVIPVQQRYFYVTADEKVEEHQFKKYIESRIGFSVDLIHIPKPQRQGNSKDIDPCTLVLKVPLDTKVETVCAHFLKKSEIVFEDLDSEGKYLRVKFGNADDALKSYNEFWIKHYEMEKWSVSFFRNSDNEPSPSSECYIKQEYEEVPMPPVRIKKEIKVEVEDPDERNLLLAPDEDEMEDADYFHGVYPKRFLDLQQAPDEDDMEDSDEDDSWC